MKPNKVLLFCSPAFLNCSLYKGKIDTAISLYLGEQLGKIKPITSKNSTFTLGPSVLDLTQKRFKQVLKPVKVQVFIDDSSPLTQGFQNYHLEFNPYLETNT